jgi:hypothetical protein
MSEQRFDLSYEGLIVPGVDPEGVRQRLGAIFKIPDKGVERLFSGSPVIVKRDIDGETAERYERVFANAGAILTVIPRGAALPDPEEMPPPAAPSPLDAIDTSHLALAPPGAGPLEEPQIIEVILPDIDHLRLVEGDWTLEDCEPPPTPIPTPDLSWLTLVPLAPREDSELRAEH